MVNKIWGTSSNNIYIVGNNGTMAHYNGSTWQKIESGTDLPIQDIWGALNPNTSKQEILCVASERSLNKGKKLLKIDGNTVTALPDSGLPWSLSSVWFISNEKYYIAGDGIYEKEKLNNEIWKNGPLDITTYYTYKIRGKKSNDIAAAGGVGEVLHYNGNSWKSYFSETKLSFGNYLSVDIKGDIIVAVGIDNPKAFIAFGKR
ncbi:MAG: hypothetical protein ABI550_09780 [Ignavibacteriaceae bacterium]